MTASSPIENIVINVISEFIFVIIIALMAFIGGWLLYRSARRRLLRFFKISKTRRINVYLSNIRVVPGGSIGIDNQPRAFRGETVSFDEMFVGSQFRDLFISPLPLIFNSTGFLRNFLIGDTQFRLLRSPIDKNQIDTSTTLISLGSPGYNVVSKYIEDIVNSHAKFNSAFSSIIVSNVPPIESLEYGFVEKITDSSNNNCCFYTAGLHTLGTIGAANFLARNWLTLEKKFRDKDFVVMLRFDNTDPNRWTIVFEQQF